MGRQAEASPGSWVRSMSELTSVLDGQSKCCARILVRAAKRRKDRLSPVLKCAHTRAVEVRW